MWQLPGSASFRYAVAVASVTTALTLGLALHLAVPLRTPYLFFSAVVVFSAFVGRERVAGEKPRQAG